MTGVTLGIETSGFAGLVALRRGGQLFEERELEDTRRRHAQTLIQELQTLLRNHGVAPQDVDLVGVSHGPGSFTGLRVGIVVAKTFAYATDCRLVAVDTFAAIAEAADQSVTCLSVVSDAQREQLFVGEFVRNPQTDLFERPGSTTIVDADAWCASLTGRACAGFAIAGPVLKKLAGSIPSGVRQLDEPAWQPRASAVAAIAERLATAGQVADPFELEPFYLRKSSAEEKRDARQQ
ncbi:tRNA (adenosine(37)-N6)-threonylcarbamoyltransferase complex dimerization subunit type 1 TsaB [bacterium]|nr:tRNA (adenosine(37)-N6)-threonylcarbamoyltransferase complex dimerization subunit type 1 TsaB [bacterium]